MRNTLTIISVTAQEVPIDFINRINNVEYIFEGIVLESKPYYSDNDRFIRTSNLVEITKILKGDLSCGTIEIITNGGRLNDKELSISHSLELTKGSMGIFLCDLTNRPLSVIDFHSETNIEKLEGKFENQSFIRYWWNGTELSASDIWLTFDSLEAVYNYTELISGYNFTDCNSTTSLNPIEIVNKKKIETNINFKSTNQFSFYPQTIAGGVNDTLTIVGSGFTNTKGEILLPNANNGGNSSILLENYEIAFWSDTIIKFVIPSLGTELTNNPNLYGTPVGSGYFNIFSYDSSWVNIYTSSTPLKVKFSIINYYDKFPCVIAPWQSLNKKFTFHCDTSIANYDNGMMKSTIEKALKDWKCLTGIDWKLGEDTIYNLTESFEDEFCIISFKDYHDTVSVLAATTVRRDKEVNVSTNDSSFHIYEVDIKINNDYVWFCDTSSIDTVPTGQKDFYHVILHELGHAHGLQHVIDTNAILHYSVPPNYKRIT